MCHNENDFWDTSENRLRLAKKALILNEKFYPMQTSKSEEIKLTSFELDMLFGIVGHETDDYDNPIQYEQYFSGLRYHIVLALAICRGSYDRLEDYEVDDTTYEKVTRTKSRWKTCYYSIDWSICLHRSEIESFKA